MAAELPTAVFRADASEAIGGGHVMRCLTLSAALAETGWHVGFAVNAQALSVVPSLAEAASDILVLGQDDESSALKEHWPDRVALLIVDHYGRDLAFEQRCRPWAAAILAIDDLANRCHRVDILLDQTHGREESDYRALTGTECRLLLGARFALLRPQFPQLRRRALARRESAAPARRLLLSFGAADPAGVTLLALQAVAEACPALSVDVVVGASSRNWEEIHGLAASVSPAVTVHRSVHDMASLMTEADFAVGACGGTSWERCCLGLPALVVVTADNQRHIARNLAAAGAIEVIGNAGEVTVEDLATRIAALIDDPSRRHAMAHAAAVVCDGEGADRVAAAMTQETVSRAAVSLPGRGALPRCAGLSSASARRLASR